jgi:3-oxoacyl-[acyl-carrier protein] reductase
MELKDQIVLITGSSQGIGKETALLFAKEGAKVVITYNSNKTKAEEVFKECKKLNDCLLLKLNVKDESSINECVEKTIDYFGAIDVLVNNAGVLVRKDFSEQNDKDIDSQIDTNVKGLMKMTKKVLPYMKGQGSGVIVNVASICAHHVFNGLTVYCASKFAVHGFTKALALEFPKEIKVFSINPGLTATEMTGYAGVNPKKVGEVILKAVKEEIKVKQGDEVDVEDYI